MECPYCDRVCKNDQAYNDHLKFSKACVRVQELERELAKKAKIESDYAILLEKYRELYESQQKLINILGTINK